MFEIVSQIRFCCTLRHCLCDLPSFSALVSLFRKISLSSLELAAFTNYSETGIGICTGLYSNFGLQMLLSLRITCLFLKIHWTWFPWFTGRIFIPGLTKLLNSYFSILRPVLQLLCCKINIMLSHTVAKECVARSGTVMRNISLEWHIQLKFSFHESSLSQLISKICTEKPKQRCF